MPFDDTNIKRLYEQQTNKKWKFRAKVENALTEQVIFIETPSLWRMKQQFAGFCQIILLYTEG